MIMEVRSRFIRTLRRACLASLGRLQLFAPFLAPFLNAFFASTAIWFDEPADIVATVIVGDLVAWLDVLDGANEYLAVSPPIGFAIGAAGVVGVAADVLSA